MADIAGHPYWQVHFDTTGTLTPSAGLPTPWPPRRRRGPFFMSHGWGSSEGAAENLPGHVRQIAAPSASARRPAAGPVGFAGRHLALAVVPRHAGHGGADGAAVAARIRRPPAGAGSGRRQSGAVRRPGYRAEARGALDAGTAGVLAQAASAAGAARGRETRPAREAEGRWTALMPPTIRQATTRPPRPRRRAPPAGRPRASATPRERVERREGRAAGRLVLRDEGRAGAVGRPGIGPMLERLHAAPGDSGCT